MAGLAGILDTLEGRGDTLSGHRTRGRHLHQRSRVGLQRAGQFLEALLALPDIVTRVALLFLDLRIVLDRKSVV